MRRTYDAVIVGSGPNGLAAAITLARAGRSVLVVEAQEIAGGGLRTEELTLPGFHHDVFSAVHPLGLESSFFQQLPLENFGLKWIGQPAAFTHPLADGTAVTLRRSVDETAEQLGRRDGDRYRAWMIPLLRDWQDIKAEILRPPRIPRHPFKLARFGLSAILPARTRLRLLFKDEPARALIAGAAAHSTLPFTALGGSAFGLVLALAGHHVGWPIPQGGAGAVARALVGYLRSLGGEVVTGEKVESLGQLPRTRAVLLDLTPRQVAALAGPQLGRGFTARLRRFRYGAGVFKMDWALRAPIPWTAPAAAMAATVHVGGSLDEMTLSEDDVHHGRLPERPFVLLVQPSLFDPTRAPAGCHTVWAYCHVPNASTFDMSERIERQIERFAPGFRDLILARSVLPPAALQERNANLIGGDINGGSPSLGQLFLRPTTRLYSTSSAEIFICSSSTPPGGGVHGLGGFYAASRALQGVLK
jgi:phytoene dehydrogenase-like protein